MTYPREIEGDLAFRGIDIADWHTGVMSSRKLVNLIYCLAADQNSTYSKARREFDFSDEEYLVAAQVNELRLLRGDQAAIHAGQKFKTVLIKSPRQEREHQEQLAKQKQARDSIMKQLTGVKDG